MNLLEDLNAMPEKASGGTKPCNLGSAMERLSPEERDAVHRVVADLRYSNSAISTVLRRNGVEVGESTVRNHRKGNCQWCSYHGYDWSVMS